MLDDISNLPNTSPADIKPASDIPVVPTNPTADSNKKLSKEEKNKIRRKKYAKIRRTITFKYFILALFWFIFFLMLVAVVVIFSLERFRVNNANNVNAVLEEINRSNDASQRTDLYQQLLNIWYPVIDFSLLTFLFVTGSLNSKPISDWSVAWNQRVTSINVAYSYMFISALITFVAFCMYIVIIIKLYIRTGFEKRYGLQPKFHNGYALFDTRIYLRFTRSLAIVFCFFNFLSTLIVIVYGIILLLVSFIFWYAAKEKTVILLQRKWWRSSNFILYTVIVLIQNGYNILKALFSSQFGVDLDLILAILFPIGTITVVIVILIRNLLSTSITAVRKAINNINVRISSFRVFFYSQKEKSLEDFSFVEQLPILVKRPLSADLITWKQAYDLMVKVNDSATFIEKNFKRESERKYMLFHLFNEITEIAELEDIKTNTLKVQEVKAAKKNKSKSSKQPPTPTTPTSSASAPSSPPAVPPK